jgi:uncharacterized coiled-coil DUF342 family protein
MNKEKLEKLNELSNKIDDLRKKLDSLNNVVISTNEGCVACRLSDKNGYQQGSPFNLSKGSVKIALTISKEEIKIELEQLEKEFENA